MTRYTPKHPEGGKRNEPLMTPGEVAALFRVDPKTVTRWAAAGLIPAVFTPGGHRRYRREEIDALLEQDTLPIGGGGRSSGEGAAGHEEQQEV